MRLVPALALLVACGGGDTHSWYDSPLQMKGAAYKDCTVTVSQGDQDDEDGEFNDKGSMTLWHILSGGDIYAAESWTYDKDGTTPLEYGYGPNTHDFSTTTSYEWDGDDLVGTVTWVEGDEDQGTEDVTYTSESTYGDDNKLQSTHTTSDEAEPMDVTTTWTWSDGSDGGAVATVTTEGADGEETLEFDADRWLLSDVTTTTDFTIGTVYTYGDDHLVESYAWTYGEDTGTTTVGWDDDGRLKLIDQGEGPPTQYAWSCD